MLQCKPVSYETSDLIYVASDIAEINEPILC